MAKDKKTSKAAATPAKASKIESVKAGRVTKSAQTAKAAAKDTAKKVVKEEKKKGKKEPTPEPSSSEDEDDDTSASSNSSEAEADVKPKANGKANGTAKANGNGKVVNGDASTSADEEDDDDDSESESDSEEVAKPTKAAPKANGVAANGKADATSDDDSDDASSDDEDGAEVSAAAAAETNDDDDDDDDDDSSDDDDEDDDEESKPAATESKKRKADEEQSNSQAKKAKAQSDPSHTSNLWVGNLSWNVDEEWLTREFEEFGELTSVRIITDRETGRSKGYGYVTFKEVDDAVKAHGARLGYLLDNRELRVDFSEARQKGDANSTPQQRSHERAERYGDVPQRPSATLFIGNLSFDADQDTVGEHFSEYGVKSVRLITDRETGNPKGYGYIDMNSVEDAQGAFDALSGTEIAGRAIRLDYAAERTNDAGGRGGRGGGGRGFGGGRGGGRGGFGGGRGGGRGGFGDRGGRGRGGARGGRGGASTNRGGFGDFSGKKTTF